MLKNQKKTAYQIFLIFLAFAISISGLGLSALPAGAQEECTRTYRVQSGDTLSAIAVMFNTTTEGLLELNPEIEDQNFIITGQELCVSSTGAAPEEDAPDEDEGLPPTGEEELAAYVVQSGDTLSEIAVRFDTTVDHLLELNPEIENPRLIITGQRLNVPGDDILPPTGAETGTYVVSSGDTLSEIAAMFGTTVDRLLDLNPDIDDPGLIFPGERLTVPQNGDKTLPPTGAAANLTISDVNPGSSVTVQGANFPGNETFDVLIGEAGDAEDAVEAASFTTPQNGAFTRAFDIPDEFSDVEDLIIQFESTQSELDVQEEFTNSEEGREEVQEPDGLDLPEEPAAQATAELAPGERTTLAQGNAGAFFSESAYDGTLVVSRYDPAVAGVEGLEFTQQLIQVEVLDAGGSEVEDVRGLIYAFFEITDDTQSQFDTGDLDIYRFNPESEDWEVCDTQVPIDEDEDQPARLACVIENFGVFGIAAE